MFDKLIKITKIIKYNNKKYNIFIYQYNVPVLIV